ncbi:MAG: CPBP family intramembrane metalloprotease [Oscillospiraceae bacterium]|nr:CPBP family intramembrane metalloprotease [Oscillospiraceae bacterium]
MEIQKPERPFVAPSKKELILGLIYLPLHMFVIGELLIFGLTLVDIPLTLAQLNLVYMLLGTLYLMVAMSRYMKASFAPFRAFGISHLWALPLGWALRIALTLPISIALVIFAPELANPNQDAVEYIVGQSFLASFLLAVILAPIVEEILFRGLIFAPLRKKNRFLAYAVSSIAFGFLHIAVSLLWGFTPELFLVMLLYVPAGLVLAWVYEKSGNIWTAILLHGFMNLVSILLMRLLEALGDFFQYFEYYFY